MVGGPAPAERGPQTITIQRGQTLSEIAHSYHVPMQVIAEANGLSPPYRIQVGRTLVIPGAGPPRLAAAPASVAALPPAQRPEVLQPTTGPDLPPPAASDRPPVSAAPLAPPAGEAAPAVTPPPISAAPPPREIPETPDASSAAAPPAAGTGAFLWPVRGHVLATYGSRSDGTHNDGINIAAPRGTAVQAVDAGVVAYTGNELRGYGNLVLVKHANGWISAYAHCDAILVKRGEKVGRGQVIARVGSTGNVNEPQLHFELRRGQHAVDPREFMPPLPTAMNRDSQPS
ncbi:MAG TPA: M23 family metallopeptidase [Stellaceae bacterium]|nr:M23 family metallopeptidase [Stellaceae bacterium]